MEEKAKLIESLVEKATDYGKTSFELVKLKALDKTSEVVSSFVPHSFVVVLIASFLLFLNIGVAFWLGELLGRIYIGFFIIAGFYVITGLIVHFFMHKAIKKYVRGYIIKLLLR